ncbi:hypothetical protein C4561_03380 [candidate division WWE3 bacterium]|jgi:hypothetical protein|uniref:Uncharacterized protein n=1 Tax=candidate division WWE3 bacterium TaxID=2053526 RepID=A0A3A4ZCG8_UNCKA|nr:MAG: hypothetical protein C4561_03380 [candidate division WWE3 bacterium]
MVVPGLNTLLITVASGLEVKFDFVGLLIALRKIKVRVTTVPKSINKKAGLQRILSMGILLVLRFARITGYYVTNALDVAIIG